MEVFNSREDLNVLLGKEFGRKFSENIEVGEFWA
jgi:hypothetical protein